MKKTDIAMIILIAVVSVMAAFFATNAVFGEASTEEVKVRKIDPIKGGIDPVDPAIFNSEAINPAVEVQITPNGQ